MAPRGGGPLKSPSPPKRRVRWVSGPIKPRDPNSKGRPADEQIAGFLKGTTLNPRPELNPAKRRRSVKSEEDTPPLVQKLWNAFHGKKPMPSSSTSSASLTAPSAPSASSSASLTAPTAAVPVETGTAASSSFEGPPIDKQPIYRCEVVKIPIENPQDPKIVGIELAEIGTNRSIWVSLCESWAENWRDDKWLLRPGDLVHLVSRNINDSNHVELRDSGADYLIMHPDILLTGTMVANTLDCKRQAMIQDEYSDIGLPSRALILGDVTHEAFQVCMAAADFSDEFCLETLKDILSGVRRSLWAGSVDEAPFLQDCMQMLKNARDWASLYYAPVMAQIHGNSKNATFSHVVSVEQTVSSHRYGFKGKFDLLMRSTEGTMGVIELKTGKPHTKHMGQIAVYYLLLNDFANYVMDDHMLLYLTPSVGGAGGFRNNQDGFAFDKKPVDHRLVNSIIFNRNYLAAVLLRRRQLSAETLVGMLPPRPEPFTSPLCQNCFKRETCTVIAVCNNEEDVGPQIPIDEPTKAYVQKWITCLGAEASLASEDREQLWTSPNKCILGLRSGSVKKGYDGYWRWQFFQDQNNNNKSSTIFRVHDQVQISKELGPYQLFSGHICMIDKEHVVVKVKFEVPSVMRSEQGNTMCQTQLGDIEDMGSSPGVVRFRIDPLEFMGGYQKQRGSLMNLLGNQRLKELLILNHAPRFSETCQRKKRMELERDDHGDGESQNQTEAHNQNQAETQASDRASASNVRAYEALNPVQKQAVDKVFKMEDYCIIAGYPGTGKTQVLASLLESLVDEGLRVLLCAYTNSAVDNVLLRLIKNKVKFARVGNTMAIHKGIRPYAMPQKWKSTDEVEQYARSILLVACTCHSAADGFVQKQEFDIIVIDEASQCTEPVLWCSLQRAKRFVLVGDCNQLSPLVRHPEALKNRMNISLMERLSTLHPEAVVELTLQYRMNEHVQQLSNVLCYDGKLECGTEQVKKKRLIMRINNQLEPWIKECLDWEKSVVFVNTGMSMLETENGTSNLGEVQVVRTLVEGIIAGGISASDIGVLSLYRRQVSLLSDACSSTHVEVLTVDQAQGRDKSCVIVSLVRCNDDNNLGELIKDWRRLNVLLSRGKCKLLLVGSLPTLSNDPNSSFKPVLDLIKSNGWVVDVDVPEGHQQQSFVERTSVANDFFWSQNHNDGLNLGRC